MVARWLRTLFLHNMLFQARGFLRTGAGTTEGTTIVATGGPSSRTRILASSLEDVTRRPTTAAAADNQSAGNACFPFSFESPVFIEMTDM